MHPNAIVLATRNLGKIREIRSLLALPNIKILSLIEAGFQGDLPLENADTFEGNATIKAMAVAKKCSMPALADDSGLCVDALAGAPGIYSSRFAGEDANDAANIAKLLAILESVPDEARTAHFICIAVLAWPNDKIVKSEGRCNGIILREKRGYNGFGYDPLFLVPHLGLTFAELPSEIKNSISHRSRALQGLKQAVWGIK